MISTNAKRDHTQVNMLRRGATVGGDDWQITNTQPTAWLWLDDFNNFETVPINSGIDTFDFLPASAVAAGNSLYLVTIGTGTVVVARPLLGGVNLKTRAAGVSDLDIVAVVASANSSMIAPISAGALPRMKTRLRLQALTGIYCTANLDQNLTAALLDGTSGEGAGFLFDPSQTKSALSGGLNWLLTQKIGGTVTYQDSGVAAYTGADVTLDIQYGPDLIPVYWINGNQVGVGLGANAANTNVGAVVGLEIRSGSPAQSNFDVRYVMVARQVGA